MQRILSYQRRNRTPLIFTILFILNFTPIIAQSYIEASDGFAEIEAKFDIKFSYIPKDIEGIKINLPGDNVTIEELIGFLNKNDVLSFKLLESNRIAVALKSNITICGIILGEDDLKPLIGATIFNDQGTSTITNTDGSFILENISLSGTLRINYLGYLSKEIKSISLLKTDGKCAEILLAQSPFELNEILITNIFTSGIDKTKDGNLTLNSEKLGALPGLVEEDVLQITQVLPGVESINESVADINIRSGSHDQNLILWDGIKMYQSGHFFGLISAFNPLITKNVTIIKDGTSAAYTDGVSGTIDMRSKDQLVDNIAGSITTTLLNINAGLEIPISSKISLFIAGRRSFTDVVATPTYTEYFDRSFQNTNLSSNTFIREENADFYFYDVSSKLIYEIDKHHTLSGNFLYINNQLSYTEPEGSSSQASRISNLDQRNLAIGYSLKSQWTDKFKTSFKNYYTVYNLDALDNNISTNQSLRQLNQVVETNVQWDTYYQLSESLLWHNGYSYTETGAENASDVKNPTYQIIKKRVNRNHGLYSELTFNKNKTYIRGGIRVNYFERLKSTPIEPRFNIRQGLGNYFSLKLTGELKNQTTTQFVDLNEDFLGVDNRRWLVSEVNNIPVLKSTQLSTGIDYKKKGWYIELTGFYRKIKDIISDSQRFRVQNQFDGAVGEIEGNGIEFLVNKRFAENNLWFSYTFNNSNYIFEDIATGKFPSNYNVKHSLSSGLSYQITNDFSISIAYNWRTGRPYTKPVESEETFMDGNFIKVNYEAPNSHSLPNYSRLDGSLSYAIALSKEKSLTVKAGILNILNKENIIDRYYRVSDENQSEAEEINITSLKFTPNASLQFRF